MIREDKIHLIGFIIVTGFALALASCYVDGVYLQQSYPHNTFLFRPWDRFMDFINDWRGWNSLPNFFFPEPGTMIRAAANVHVLQWNALIPFLFSRIHPARLAYLLYALIGIGFLWCTFWRNLRQSRLLDTFLVTFVLTFMSYPVLFWLDRGNLEIFVFIFICLAVFAYKREYSYWTAVFLSLALLIKPFPVVFLAMLVAGRKYKALLSVVPFYALVTLVAGVFLAWHFGLDPWPMPTGGAVKSGNWIDAYNRKYVIGNEGLFFGNSLFGLFKVAMAYLGKGYAISSLLRPYFFGVILVGVAVVSYVVFFEKALWKQVALLTCCMNLLPFVSGDYRLLHLFIPMFLFINKESPAKTDGFYAVLFALLLVPKAYGHFWRISPEASASIVLNPLLMLLMVMAILIEGWGGITRENFKVTVAAHFAALRLWKGGQG